MSERSPRQSNGRLILERLPSQSNKEVYLSIRKSDLLSQTAALNNLNHYTPNPVNTSRYWM